MGQYAANAYSLIARLKSIEGKVATGYKNAGSLNQSPS